MGSYDFFTGSCPSCGREIGLQTKLADCVMRDYKVGDEMQVSNMKLWAKDSCYNCKARITVEISNGKVVAFSLAKPTHKEGSFGAVTEER